MKVMMKESYSNLKLYFSSQNCGANCNLSHLVIFAEHAVKVGLYLLRCAVIKLYT